MTDKELWHAFLQENPDAGEDYDAWAFGAQPDYLAQLVLMGEKTATASAYPLYEIDGEELPKEGAYSILLDSRENALCVVKTTKISIVPFCQVSAEQAYKEGEGDKSLAYWRQVHESLFTQWMEQAGLTFTQEMPVVCEEFTVVFRPHP